MATIPAELGSLKPAEERFLSQTGSGNYHQCGDGRCPMAGDDTRAIRAVFLRLLLLRAPGMPPLHEKGLRLRGAWITGALDLESCGIASSLALADCRFESALILRLATINSLVLDGSVLPGLQARGLVARGGIYLRATRIDGAIDMLGAQLGGEFALDGSTVSQPGGLAFDGAFVTTRGDLALRGTQFRGGVKVAGAQLGGDLALTGATIEHVGETALSAENTRVGGDVALRSARILGETNFIGARITGDVQLEGGTFEAPEAIAFTLNRAVVDGALFLRHGTQMRGALSLNGTQVGTIMDEPASWPKPGDLLMNRFLYGGFIGGPVDAQSRLDWLARQNPARWGEDFWPQPYAQLSAVLNEMGHKEEARTVLYEKERLQRRARRARAKWPSTRAGLAIMDTLLWFTVGYGLQPLMAFVWLLLFWLAGAGLLAMIQMEGEMRPNVAVFLRSPEWVLCGEPVGRQVTLVSLGQERDGLAAPRQSQLDCFLAQPEASSFPKFNKWMYSLEALIPGLEAGQRNYWSPDTRYSLGYVGKLFEYVQMIVGFGLGLLAFAGFTGIVKSQ